MPARRTKSKALTVEQAQDQALLAEGAPAALDFLGLSSSIGDLISRSRKKRAASRSAKKKRSPGKKKAPRRTARASQAKTKAKRKKRSSGKARRARR